MSRGTGSGDDSKKDRKKDPKHNAELTLAADVLQGLLQNSKSQLADGFVRWRLEKVWDQIVGPTIGEQTLPVAFEHGTLFIWVRHSAWMQQLWFFQEAIKEKVNDHLGKAWVEQVRFTLSKRAATIDPNNR